MTYLCHVLSYAFTNCDSNLFAGKTPSLLMCSTEYTSVKYHSINKQGSIRITTPIAENCYGFYLPGDKGTASGTAPTCSVGASTKETPDLFLSNLTQTRCLLSGLEAQNPSLLISLLSSSSYLAGCLPSSSDLRHS